MNEIIIKDFVKLLIDTASVMEVKLPEQALLSQSKTLLYYGRIRGWAEELDEIRAEEPIERREAARIIHQFMRKELGITDVEASWVAGELQDLYTCRVCVNHVMQVYARKLFEAEETQTAEGKIVKIFNMLGTVSTSEAKQIIERMYSLSKKL